MVEAWVSVGVPVERRHSDTPPGATTRGRHAAAKTVKCISGVDVVVLVARRVAWPSWGCHKPRRAVTGGRLLVKALIRVGVPVERRHSDAPPGAATRGRHAAAKTVKCISAVDVVVLVARREV